MTRSHIAKDAMKRKGEENFSDCKQLEYHIFIPNRKRSLCTKKREITC